MQRRRLFIMLAVFCSLLFAMTAHAQLPQITSGLSYLTSSQNPDGTWETGTSPVETTEITVSTLETLKLLNQTAGTSYTTGVSWLQGQSPQTVAYIAERIHALNLADGSVNALIPMIDTLKGAWGGYDGYETNALDTSLALHALKSANYPDQTIINSALAYLTTNQNPDGGWGFSAGDDSNVYLTAIISATLQQFPQMTAIATAVSKATTYLLAHQNPDGGFGPSTGSGQALSTVYETALAYAALVAVSINDAALGSAVNYLTTNQSANGSWNDDPYSTALALKALYLAGNKPAPPPPPPAAGKFTGTVLDATTRQGVSGVAIVLESSPLINTTTDAAGNFTLADVPPGSQKVAFSLTGYASTSVSATSVADVTVSLGAVAMTSAYSTGTISGTIFDPAGRPLGDVAIAVSGSWSGSAVTGADGTFSFSFVTPGDVTIIASKTGYQNFSGTGRVYARTTLSISPRLNTTTSQITTGTIIGRVVDDMSGFPIDHLPEEQGVRVTLSGGAFVEPDPNNGGYFTLQGLAPNTYQVTVGMSGFVSQTFRLIIVQGVTTDMGTIRLVMSADTMTLTGKVTDSVTGLPIPAAEVVVVGSNLTARADFAGTYVIADIKEPEFTVKTSASGYVGKTASIYQGGGKGARWTQQMDVTLAPLATKGGLNGTVVDAVSGQPLAGVTLTLPADPGISVTTDSSGAFSFAAVPKGLQQAGLSLNGYTGRTLTAVIMSGMVNSVGNIPLSPNPLPAVVTGKVSDGVTKLPFSGVEILVKGNGDQQTSTNSNGDYSIDAVVPGTITLVATDRTKTGYYPASITAPLEPGGILVFSPSLFTNLAATVSATLQTDKTVYSKGETVGVAVSLQNLQAIELAATLRLQITDPSGMAVYDTNVAANLAADGSLTRNLSFQLPAYVPGGTYAVSAILYDATGIWVGGASQSFGVAVSRITMSPVLPAAFSTGANSVSFNLANVGDLPVSSGTFKVTLKGPDGQLVTNVEQAFSLGIGESKTLLTTISVPQLKFGTYILAYTQSDETRTGNATEIALPNAVTIAASFDSNSHRVRDTAGLTLTLTNSGRFNLDTASTVTMAVPDAAITETRSLSPVPVGGSSTTLYSFPIPAAMTAGEHNTIVTLALPGGSSSTTGAKLVIFEAALSLAPLQESYAAGETISPVIANSGGVDASLQCRLSLYDAKGTMIAEKNSSEPALAGASLPLSLVIPTGAVDGSYNLVVNYKDLTTAKEEIVTYPLTISGVKGSIQVQTGKQGYLGTENITEFSKITNSGIPLQGGNLHLLVTNATGNRQQKTWTSQADFQQGVRSGVDTFDSPGTVTLLSYADSFNGGMLNLDRWSPYVIGGTFPFVENGQLNLSLPPASDWIRSFVNSKGMVSGDFDATVDYNVDTTAYTNGDNHPAGMQAFIVNPYLTLWIDIWGSPLTYGSTDNNYSSANASGAAYKGSLRIKRAGSNYYSYYWKGSSWVNLLSTYNRPAGPIQFRLVDVGPNGRTIARFDNFSLANHVYTSTGTIQLKNDYGRSEAWGSLSFDADMPQGTSLSFRTRSAETEAGLTTASWSSPITVSNAAVASPKGRWLEVETTMATTSTLVSPVLREVTVTQGHNPGEIFWQADVPVNLAQGATTDLSNTIGALSQSGKYYLQGTLSSSTGQAVATAEYPFYVVQGNMLISLSPDRKLYKPGETVTISGVVTNLSTVAAANLSLTVKAKAGTGAELTLLGDTFTIAAGAGHPFNVTTVAGGDGVVTLTATVVQNTATLAAVGDQFEVASPKVTASLSGPDAAVSESASLTLTLVNSGKTDAAINVARSFGSAAETVTVPAGQTRVLQYQLKITTNTTCTFTLTGDLTQQLTKTIVYVAPKQAATISAKMVTDRISYNANEKVAITATITCLDIGTTGDTLTARVLIAGSGGDVLFTDAISLPLLNTGRVYTSSRYWNSAAYPPGTYTARVVVEGGEVALATAEATFTILTSSATAAGVTGALSAVVNPVYLGIDQSLAVTLVNSGNEDLTEAVFSVTVVNPDTQAIMQTYGKAVTLPRQGTLADAVIVPTGSLEERDYLAVLQITLPGMAQAKTLAGASFSMKIAPPPTLLLSTLSNGAVTNNQTLNVTGSATGVVAMKSVTINGAGVPFNSDGSFSHALLLQQGINPVTTTVTDVLEHAISDTRAITLDQKAPVLTITSPSDNSKTAISPVEIRGSVDENATVTVKAKDNIQTAAIDGTEFSATVTLEPGWNTIEITAVDLAGNLGSQKRSVLFDDQKPSLAITEPGQDIRTNQGLTIRGLVSDPYTAVSVAISMDDQTFNPVVADNRFEQAIGFNAEKSYAVVVTATNEVGVVTTAQRNITYDITPPTVAIDQVTSPTAIPGQTVSGSREEGAVVTVSCSTATVGDVEYPTATSWRAALSGFAAAGNSIVVTATDAADNHRVVTTQIIYDTTPPTGNIAINGGAGFTSDLPVSLDISASDTNGVSKMQLSNDGTAWNDPEPFISVKPWNIPTGDGLKQVFVRYQDNAGNWSVDPIVASITLDTMPPVIAVSAAGGIYKTPQLVQLTANELATIYCTADGSAPGVNSAICSSPLTIAANTVLKCLAIDRAGNQGNRTETYVIDTLPPSLSVSTLADGSYTNNDVLNVSGAVFDNVGLKGFQINGSDVPVNTDGSFSLPLVLKQGANPVEVKATDLADNKTTDNRTIILDQTAPALTVTTPADNSKTAVALAIVIGSVDKTSTVQVKLGGNIQTVTLNGMAFTSTVYLIPASNTIEVIATDLAGNTSSQKRTIIYDDQKPSLAVTEPPQDIRTNKSSLTISGTASDPYTAVGVTVSLDGSILTPPVVNGIFTQIVTFTDEKLYPITVTASNEVGTQTSVQRNVIFDKTPPNLTIDPVVTPTNASTQVVTGTREEGTTVAVTCASATVGTVAYPTTATWQVNLAGLTQGENKLLASVTDLADNRTTVSATILYQPKAPDVTISASPNQLWPPNKKLVPVVIAGNVVSYGSDIKNVTISIADEYGKYNLQGLKFGDTVLLEAWREGNDMDGRVYTITTVVTDRAGNRTTRSATVTVPHDMGN